MGPSHLTSQMRPQLPLLGSYGDFPALPFPLLLETTQSLTDPLMGSGVKALASTGAVPLQLKKQAVVVPFHAANENFKQTAEKPYSPPGLPKIVPFFNDSVSVNLQIVPEIQCPGLTSWVLTLSCKQLPNPVRLWAFGAQKAA